MIFKRKIYDKLLEWKARGGETALMIEGARRVGKSTIAETFAKNEYKSYILIDFSNVSNGVKDAFKENLHNLNEFFQIISATYLTQLYERNTLFIFDEVQLFPIARQAIKTLVKDRRFDYIETGSLLSLKKNVDNILLPSEEECVYMYPMDFEEFALALGKEQLINYIKICYENKTALKDNLHKDAMRLFREYLIVGGMPQVVSEYIENEIHDFTKAERAKKLILNLYRNDIMKIDEQYRSRVMAIFDNIPAFLSRHERRIIYSEIQPNTKFENYEDTFFWLNSSMTVNLAFNTRDPEIGLSLNEDRTLVKCYMGDTGLLLSHTFSDNDTVDPNLYKELYLGKLSVNEGMFFENVIAQTLRASGHKLYFYTHYDQKAKRNDMEIDFVISRGGKIKNKIYPIEVKSSDNYSYPSLSKFKEKYNKRIGNAYVIHTKQYSEKDGIIFLPCYMAFLI